MIVADTMSLAAAAKWRLLPTAGADSTSQAEKEVQDMSCNRIYRPAIFVMLWCSMIAQARKGRWIGGKALRKLRPGQVQSLSGHQSVTC